VETIEIGVLAIQLKFRARSNAGSDDVDGLCALLDVIGRHVKHGNVRYEFEARLALCEVEAKTDPAAARAKTLEEQARSKGFALIARKAASVGA
jgi:hypothetical protein